MTKNEDEAERTDDSIVAALAKLQAGDQAAWQELMPLVYPELHSIARREMAKQGPGHTLQPTALVSELFMKLCRGSNVRPARHADFLGLCATAMRRILTDHARAKQTDKRKLPGPRVAISDALDLAIEDQWRHAQVSVLELNDLIDRYAQFDATGARLIELRYFAGRSVAEAASALGIAPRTADRVWETARAWLKRELSR